MTNIIFHSVLFSIIFMLLINGGLCDQQSGFSQGCYTACPKKTWNLQTSSHEQVDKLWLQCLKDCHQSNSWKLVIIFAGLLLVTSITFVLIYIYCGQKIRFKYIFHVQRIKRMPIISDDEGKTRTFQQNFKTFRDLIEKQVKQIYIEFQNDKDTKKVYLVQSSIFHQKQNQSLEIMFSISISNRRKAKQNQIENQQIKIQEHSQVQLETFVEQYSQLVGAFTFTAKGLNLWWIKIDDKHSDINQRCKWFARMNQKYYSVYQKDPYAPENSFIGNIVLQDSSKQQEERYTRYFIKKRQPNLFLQKLEKTLTL